MSIQPNLTTNTRGFPMLTFVDRYGASCSLLKSSLAFEEAVWLGIDHADPKIMATDAAAHGLATTEKAGWIPYPVPAAVLFNTRMHLSREQVAQLIPYLQHFVNTGRVEDPSHSPPAA